MQMLQFLKSFLAKENNKKKQASRLTRRLKLVLWKKKSLVSLSHHKSDGRELKEEQNNSNKHGTSCCFLTIHTVPSSRQAIESIITFTASHSHLEEHWDAFQYIFLLCLLIPSLALKKARWLKDWLCSGNDNGNAIEKRLSSKRHKHTDVGSTNAIVTVLSRSFSLSLWRFELRARWRTAKHGIKLGWNYHINGKQMDFGLRHDCRYSATLPRPSPVQRCSVKGLANDWYAGHLQKIWCTALVTGSLLR